MTDPRSAVLTLCAINRRGHRTTIGVTCGSMHNSDKADPRGAILIMEQSEVGSGRRLTCWMCLVLPVSVGHDE